MRTPKFQCDPLAIDRTGAPEATLSRTDPWPKTVIILVLVGMAFWKAALVGLYYMHLRFEPKRLRILAIAPLPLFAVLVLAVITEYIW